MSEITLGQYAESLTMSPAGLLRVKTLLKDPRSINFRVLVTSINSQEPKYCVRMAKDLGITGHRAGKKSQRERIFGKLQIYSQSSNAKEEQLFWKLYRWLITNYIVHKVQKLQILLKTVKISVDQKNQSVLLNEIFRHSDHFGVTNDQLKEFYFLWPFEIDHEFESRVAARIQNFANLPLSEDKELLKKAQTKTIEQFESKIEVLRKELTKSHQQLNTKLASLDKSIDIVKQSQDSSIKETYERVSGLTKSIENVRKTIKDLPDYTVLKNVRNDLKELTKEVSKVSELVITLSRTTENQKAEIAKVNEKIGRKYVKSGSDSTKGLRIIDFGKHSITELEFVNYWRGMLSTTPFSNLSIEECFAAHIFFKTFKCIVLSDGLLFDTWVDALGWKGFVKTCAADPSWISQKSCVELTDFCASDGTPEVLKILNFNSAFYEGYLAPNLLIWKEREELQNRKIVLIGVAGEQLGLAEPVHSIPCMLSNSGRMEDAPIFKKTQGHIQPVTKGFLISTLSVWDSETNDVNYGDSGGISNLLASKDIELPPQQLINFNRMRNVLELYFDDKSAILVAYQFTIFPWLKLCKNEIYAEQVSRDMKVAYG